MSFINKSVVSLALLVGAVSSADACDRPGCSHRVPPTCAPKVQSWVEERDVTVMERREICVPKQVTTMEARVIYEPVTRQVMTKEVICEPVQRKQYFEHSVRVVQPPRTCAPATCAPKSYTPRTCAPAYNNTPATCAPKTCAPKGDWHFGKHLGEMYHNAKARHDERKAEAEARRLERHANTCAPKTCMPKTCKPSTYAPVYNTPSTCTPDACAPAYGSYSSQPLPVNSAPRAYDQIGPGYGVRPMPGPRDGMPLPPRAEPAMPWRQDL